ncbi:MAG: universal stress protein [Cyclobacteriaceae bacterium]
MRILKKILISTDFSPAAWRSVKMGLDFSTSRHVCITLLHVYPSKKADDFGTDTDQRNISDLKREMQRFCAEIEETVDACIEPVLLVGDVNKEIIEFIKKEPYDLVIIGVNSNGSNNDPGSHTAEIIKSSTVPVLVVPNLPLVA